MNISKTHSVLFWKPKTTKSLTVLPQLSPSTIKNLKLRNSFLFQVRYTGYRDRPQEERMVRFQNACREGHTEIAFAATGTNLQLMFSPPTTGYMNDKECDFDKEPGKVSSLRNGAELHIYANYK